jgi:FPC/CPF motif-containing protein YcgG
VLREYRGLAAARVQATVVLEPELEDQMAQAIRKEDMRFGFSEECDSGLIAKARELRLLLARYAQQNEEQGELAVSYLLFCHMPFDFVGNAKYCRAPL